MGRAHRTQALQNGDTKHVWSSCREPSAGAATNLSGRSRTVYGAGGSFERRRLDDRSAVKAVDQCTNRVKVDVAMAVAQQGRRSTAAGAAPVDYEPSRTTSCLRAVSMARTLADRRSMGSLVSRYRDWRSHRWLHVRADARGGRDACCTAVTADALRDRNGPSIADRPGLSPATTDGDEGQSAAQTPTDSDLDAICVSTAITIGESIPLRSAISRRTTIRLTSRPDWSRQPSRGSRCRPHQLRSAAAEWPDSGQLRHELLHGHSRRSTGP